MARLLAATGLALALLLALTGSTPSAAPSQPLFAVTGSAELSGTRVGPAVFTAAGVPKRCRLATVGGHLSGTAPTLSLEPIFDECVAEALSGLSVKWVISSCTFDLRRPRPLGKAGRWRSEVDLSCPGELPLMWNVYENAHEHSTGQTLCATEAPPQRSIGSALLSNVAGSPGTVRIEWDLHGIEYKAFGFELLCGSAAGTRRSDAAYHGTTEVRATSGGRPVGFALRG